MLRKLSLSIVLVLTTAWLAEIAPLRLLSFADTTFKFKIFIRRSSRSAATYRDQADLRSLGFDMLPSIHYVTQGKLLNRRSFVSGLIAS